MTPEISSLSNSFKTTSFFNVKLHNLQTGTEEKVTIMPEKGKGLNSFYTQQYPSLRMNRLQDTSHTLIQTQTTETCGFPGFSDCISPTFHKHKEVDRTYISDTDPRPHEHASQHRLPPTTAWELFLRVRPKPLGSE